MDKNFISLGWFRGEEKPNPNICPIIVVRINDNFINYSYSNSGFLLCYYNEHFMSWFFLSSEKDQFVKCALTNHWVEKWEYLF